MVEATHNGRTPGTGVIPYVVLVVKESSRAGTLDEVWETGIEGSYSDCCSKRARAGLVLTKGYKTLLRPKALHTTPAQRWPHWSVSQAS